MTVEELISYCLAKPGAVEDYPWGDDELVAKVGGKGFAFIWLEGASVSLKCGATSDDAAVWRERYPDAVTQSHYIGRFGWNSVQLSGEVPDDEVREMVDASHQAIVAKLPKSRRP